VNSNLPEETTLIIPSIGVNATVNYDRSGESGLEKGVWQPPNFGDPISGLPMLMMSHKYGLFGWSNDYRVQNSFGSLHLLNPGDKIIIIYEQREFEYIVTDKYEAAEPTEVNSDLMLYTCKTFRSDIRTTIEAKQVI
jgi:sortase (surface protein transpeptidase)